jgi:hypothetical protein
MSYQEGFCRLWFGQPECVYLIVDQHGKPEVYIIDLNAEDISGSLNIPQHLIAEIIGSRMTGHGHHFVSQLA